MRLNPLLALLSLTLLPLAASAADEVTTPSYSTCFNLLREQVKKDAVAQQNLSKNPLAIAADLGGASATSPGLVDALIMEDRTVLVTSLPVNPAPAAPPTLAAQCKAMYFLTY